MDNFYINVTLAAVAGIVAGASALVAYDSIYYFFSYTPNTVTPRYVFIPANYNPEGEELLRGEFMAAVNPAAPTVPTLGDSALYVAIFIIAGVAYVFMMKYVVQSWKLKQKRELLDSSKEVTLLDADIKNNKIISDYSNLKQELNPQSDKIDKGKDVVYKIWEFCSQLYNDLINSRILIYIGIFLVIVVLYAIIVANYYEYKYKIKFSNKSGKKEGEK